jgi:hypothetical protein
MQRAENPGLHQRTCDEKDAAQPLPTLCYAGKETVAEEENPRGTWSESI